MGEQPTFLPPNGENPIKPELVAQGERENIFEVADSIIGTVNRRTNETMLMDKELIVSAKLGYKIIDEDKENLNDINHFEDKEKVGFREIIKPCDSDLSCIGRAIDQIKALESQLGFGFGQTEWTEKLHAKFKEIRLAGEVEEVKNLVDQAKVMFNNKVESLLGERMDMVEGHRILGQRSTDYRQSLEHGLNTFVANNGERGVTRGPVRQFINRSFEFVDKNIIKLVSDSWDNDGGYRQTLSDSMQNFTTVMDGLMGKK